MTIEDPVEYELEGIGQTQVNAKVEMTFARGLRAILRQDPDVVLVGEIRDGETAQIAVQASLTGHLVLSTLHTNSALGAISRLQDMGVEPFLLSTSLLAVMSQRLVRQLCPHCRQPWQADANTARQMAVPVGARLWQPKGCPECNFIGYRGRTGIHELLLVDDRVRAAIHRGENEITLIQQLGPASANPASCRTRQSAGGDHQLGGGDAGHRTANDGKRLRWPCFAIRRWTRRAKPAAAFSRPTPPATPASCCGTRAGWRWK